MGKKPRRLTKGSNLDKDDLIYDAVNLFLQDPFENNSGVFDYLSLKLRLEAIKRKIDQEKAAGKEEDNSSSDDEETPKPPISENPPPEIEDWGEFLYDSDD